MRAVGWSVKGLGLVLSGFILVACGGDDDPHGADASPGTGADGSVVDASVLDGSVIDAAPDDSGPGDAAPGDDGGAAFDAAPHGDAGPGGVAIDAVVTSDGFTQIRQGVLARLIITGNQLEEIDSVALGELPATVVSTSPTEVVADLGVPHGTAPGPRALTVSGPAGSATLADAIETTVYIIAAGAAPGGHGTFQSPLQLCEEETTTARAGDTLSLLAGEHVCDFDEQLSLVGGLTVVGQGADVTIVRGGAVPFQGIDVVGTAGDPPTVFRALTVVGVPSGPNAIRVSVGGPFVADDLAIEGPGLLLLGAASATITGFAHSGPGIGIDGGLVFLDVSGSGFTSSDTGIVVGAGGAIIDDSVFDGCGVGIQVGNMAPFTSPSAQVVGCELVDSAEGIVVANASVEVTDTVIRDIEVTEPASLAGVRVIRGVLTMTGGEVSGQDQVGISVEGSSFSEGGAVAFLDDVLVVGGPIGVDVTGFPDNEQVRMRDSIVRDQTVAAVRMVADGANARADLGNGGGPGGNQLSVVSGVALLDARDERTPFDRIIDCAGLTLNGRSYAGQLVEGPASLLPDYQIIAANALQF